MPQGQSFMRGSGGVIFGCPDAEERRSRRSSAQHPADAAAQSSLRDHAGRHGAGERRNVEGSFSWLGGRKGRGEGRPGDAKLGAFGFRGVFCGHLGRIGRGVSEEEPFAFGTRFSKVVGPDDIRSLASSSFLRQPRCFSRTSSRRTRISSRSLGLQGEAFRLPRRQAENFCSPIQSCGCCRAGRSPSRRRRLESREEERYDVFYLGLHIHPVFRQSLFRRIVAGSETGKRRLASRGESPMPQAEIMKAGGSEKLCGPMEIEGCTAA